jgi:hypothetical protein
MLAASCGCQMARDFLPRTHTTSTSPDGRYFAFVRQELNIDPPDDHLFFGAVGQTPKRLMDLGGDVDWCRTIVWSPDSRKVGFLIDDQRLAVFDVATAVVVQVFLGGRAREGTILHGVRIDDGVMPVTIAPAEAGQSM